MDRMDKHDTLSCVDDIKAQIYKILSTDVALNIWIFYDDIANLCESFKICTTYDAYSFDFWSSCLGSIWENFVLRTLSNKVHEQLTNPVLEKDTMEFIIGPDGDITDAYNLYLRMQEQLNDRNIEHMYTTTSVQEWQSTLSGWS